MRHEPVNLLLWRYYQPLIILSAIALNALKWGNHRSTITSKLSWFEWKNPNGIIPSQSWNNSSSLRPREGCPFHTNHMDSDLIPTEMFPSRSSIYLRFSKNPFENGFNCAKSQFFPSICLSDSNRVLSSNKHIPSVNPTIRHKSSVPVFYLSIQQRSQVCVSELVWPLSSVSRCSTHLQQSSVFLKCSACSSTKFKPKILSILSERNFMLIFFVFGGGFAFRFCISLLGCIFAVIFHFFPE